MKKIVLAIRRNSWSFSVQATEGSVKWSLPHPPPPSPFFLWTCAQGSNWLMTWLGSQNDSDSNHNESKFFASRVAMLWLLNQVKSQGQWLWHIPACHLNWQGREVLGCQWFSRLAGHQLEETGKGGVYFWSGCSQNYHLWAWEVNVLPLTRITG